MPFGVGLLAGPNVGLAGAPDQGLGIKFAIQTGLSEVQPDHPVATVFTRATWADDWVERPNLFVTTCRKTTGDQIGQATLVTEYGQMMREGDDTFVQEDPLDLNGHWVKIEFETQTGEDDVVWLGVVLQDSRTRLGGETGVHCGDQQFSCASVEWFLSKVQVTTSTVGDGADWYEIDRGLAFNAGYQQFGNTKRNIGNRSDDFHTDEYYTFSLQPRAQKWSAAEIVIYLLLRCEIFLDGGPPVALDHDILTNLAWYFPQNVETHGRTIYEIINQVVSERHGVAWNLDFDGTYIVFKSWSYAKEDITLPSGIVFPKNTYPVDLDFDDAIDVNDAVEIRDRSQVYRQVIVQGARRASVCTLSLEDGSLVTNWSAGEETEYLEAASGTAGFDALTFDKQITANDRFRVTHRMRRVFTSFKIPRNWDGMVSLTPGLGGDPIRPVFPTLDSNGDPTFDSETFLNHALRIQEQTVLLEHVDYTTDPSNSTLLDGRDEAEFMESFGLWLMDGEDGADKWARLNHLSDFGKSNDIKRKGTDVFGRKRTGFNFDCHLSMSSRQPALSILPNGPSHFQAGEQWYEDLPALSWTEPEIDYREFAFTVMIEGDSFVQATYPDTPTGNLADSACILFIELGDAFRLDYLVKGTIVGLDPDGNAKRAANDGFIQDDRPRLKDIARLLGVWHKVPRVSFRLAYAQISSLFWVGQLVQQVGSGDTLTQVNSLITAVDWDFQAGRTTITTSFTERLDVGEIL